MVNGTDIAMLTFSCVSVNHLGLISAIEKVLKRNIPVVNSPKCLTFWMILITSYASGWSMVEALAVSFLSAYAALWLNLLFAAIDQLFNYLYGKIYTTAPPAANDP